MGAGEGPTARGIERHGGRCVLAAWAAGVLMVAAARPATAEDLPRVDRVEIVGARAVAPDRLLALMRTRSPSFWRPFHSTPYRRDSLLGDLERIEDHYRNQGFLDARAELARVEPIKGGQRVRITIRIEEGEPTRVESVHFSGHRSARAELIYEAIRTRPGERYSPDRVALDRQRILGLYQDRGRPFTTVQDTVVVDGLAARVTFRIREAPATRVGDIHISGTRATKHYVIRRELTFGQGDLLERRRLLESRARLLQTGFFRDVRFAPVVVDSSLWPRLLDLDLTVSERKMGWIEAGVGYNSSQQLRLTGEVGHRNVLGNAHRLVGTTRFDFDLEPLFERRELEIEQSRMAIAFREPWMFSTRTIGTISLFSETTREPGRQTEGIEDERIDGVALAADRGVNTPRQWRVTIENRWITQRLAVVAGDSVACCETDRFVTRSISVFGRRDHRDDPFDPSTGSLQSLFSQLTGGALGGTSSFYKASLASSWYRQVRRRLVVAARLRVGWIHPFGGHESAPIDSLVPRADRFRAGGATTVRGYPEDSLGPPEGAASETDRGLFTLIGNLEARFPLVWRLAGGVFLDAGNVWKEASQFSISNFWPDPAGATLQDIRYSVGGGIRLGTPVGPLRLDYGYRLVAGELERRRDFGRRWRLHFTLGHAF